jgi:hypothetical protein
MSNFAIGKSRFLMANAPAVSKNAKKQGIQKRRMRFYNG